MSCEDIQEADWRFERGMLPAFLAEWLSRGYTPESGRPQVILTDGVTYYRYRMVHVGA